MSTWRNLLDAVCTLLPIVAFASPATVILPVLFQQNGFGSDDERGGGGPALLEMPPLALTSQMLQCFLFGVYAYHLEMWTLFVPNLAGFALGFLWSTVYPFRAAPGRGLLAQWGVQYGISLALMLAGALTIDYNPYLSSTAAAAVGVIMCTYPLPTMCKAYTEKNSKLMGSAAMNLAMFATCSAWVVHSSPLVEYDVFVLVSNAAGVAVQGSALMLRMVIAGRLRTARGEAAELSSYTTLL